MRDLFGGLFCLYINEEKCPKIVQNEEKMHFIPHMLAYAGIFLYFCALKKK